MRVEPGARPGHIVDVFDPEEGVAYEAKVGFKTLTPVIRDQIDADVALLEDLASGVLRVEWHFYPSAVTKDWGPSISLMDYLGSGRQTTLTCRSGCRTSVPRTTAAGRRPCWATSTASPDTPER